MSTRDPDKTSGVDQRHTSGPWDPALDTLSEWDPTWADACVKMTTNPWTSGVLSHKLVELIGVGLNAACTNLNPDGTRRTSAPRSTPAPPAPVWTDEFMATGAGIYGGGVMSAKDTELLSIAFDASYTHMYAPGTRRHIHNAQQAGATMEEIMEVLKLCVVQGVQACNLGVPILAEELARHSGRT